MAFRFRKFKVYHDAMSLHIKVVKLTSKFSTKFNYLVSQGRRSSLSVVLNIAEGSAKISDKDFNRYIQISLGSVSETISILETALKLELITQSEFDELEKGYEEVANQLGGLSKTLKKS